MVQVQSTGVIIDWPHGFSAQIISPSPATTPAVAPAIAPSTTEWMVVHTYPRQDKKVIELLQRKNLSGIAFFERRLRHYPGKGKQESLVPLLPGYLFVAAGRTGYDSVYATERVVRIIDVRNPLELTNDLCHLIKLLTVSQAPMVVRPELVAGKRITIVTGTFAGCSGVITRRKQDMELVVNLELLGTSVAVTLPAMYAELFTNP
jgi:transcription antitermination factor NusG